MIEVTVICLCYNHARFVKEALLSVFFQTFTALELIIIDDCSTDLSVQVIEKLLSELPQYGLKSPASFQFIKNEMNLGNCKSFNKALKLAKGKFIIDFATDDVMLDNRIENQVKAFGKLDETYAMVFSNAIYISEKGQITGYHYPVDQAGQAKNIPSGNLYLQILTHYFICTPTMMMRKNVLDELDGYDENLSYEDFDFWVRTAKKYNYHFLNEITTQKRSVKNSLSTKFYQKNNNEHLSSTLLICKKAFLQNTEQEENKALAKTLEYYIRQSFYTQNFQLVTAFRDLLQEIQKPSRLVRWIIFFSKYKIRIFWLYKIYLFLKNKIS